MESKEPEEEKTITIFLQAHGYIVDKTYVPLDEAKHCEILSFTGSIGKAGIMKRTCGNLVIPPQEINGLPGGLPRMELDGPQLDVMAVSYVQKIYTHISKNSSIDDNRKSEFSFNIVINGIPLVYANCGVTSFNYHTKMRTQINGIPFHVIHPLQEKEYQLHPISHEDCLYPSVCSREGDCELLDKSKQFCPIYGIFIVHSSNREDIDYTLCGKDAQDDITIANLNSEESHYNGTSDFWENKINERWDDIIENERDETQQGDLLREKTRIVELYQRLTRVLDSSRPTSDKITMEEPLPVILLSELLTIFIKGMGYDKLNILDPSCDTCIKLTPLKLAANIVLQEVRGKRVLEKRRKDGFPSVKRRKGFTTLEKGDDDELVEDDDDGDKELVEGGGKRRSRRMSRRRSRRRSRRMKTRRVKRGKKVTYKRYKRY